MPDLYVYIHSPVHRLLENIGLRGRDYEKEIKGEYLKKIQDGYFEYMKNRTDMKILIIDSEKIDFVNNEKDYIFIKKQTKHIRPDLLLGLYIIEVPRTGVISNDRMFFMLLCANLCKSRVRNAVMV